MKKQLLIFLVLEIVIAALAPLVFGYLHPRMAAALTAGTLFTGLGFYIYFVTWRWPKSSFTFWVNLFYLYVISAPMLLVRIIFWEKPFVEIKVLGMQASTLHIWSRPVYMVLIAATIFDFLRTFLKQNSKPSWLSLNKVS